MEVADVIVVGGGIAGLSAAHGLVGEGAGRVRLLEREDGLCTHSSGRNAAIFRQLATTAGDFELGRRGHGLMTALLGSEEAWLRRSGNWFVAERPQSLERFVALAAREGVPFERAEGAALMAAIPHLEGGAARFGVLFPGDGVMDIAEVTLAISRAATRGGAVISLDAEVGGIEVKEGRIAGVRLVSGERIAAGAVVIAGGAWGESLGASCGAPLSLTPLRRHLAILEASWKLDPGAPIVWDAEHEVYVRPESGGVLSSPGDEEPWRAELPPSSQAGLELLAVKLARFAPRFAEAGVRRAWACLRTFTADRAAAVGPDPRVRGLYWLAGLGGHGMTGGLAAGELLACTWAGRPHPLADVLAPARLVASGGVARAAVAG